MLTELIELGQKMKEQMKDTQNEIKQNIQGTNSDRKEIMIQSNDLEQKEEINIQPDQNEKTRIQTNEERLRILWDNPKHSNIQITEVPEEKNNSKKLKTYLKKIMKENFLTLVKEIDFQEVQEAQTVPKNLDPRKHTPRHTIITVAKIEDEERILKPAREKGTVTYRGVPIRLSGDFSKQTLQARRDGKKYLKSGKARTYIQD